MIDGECGDLDWLGFLSFNEEWLFHCLAKASTMV